MNFNEYSNTGKTYGSTRGRGNSSKYATGNNRPRGPTNIIGDSISSTPTSNELQAGVKRIKEDVNPATRTGGKFRSLNQRATTIKRAIHIMQVVCVGDEEGEGVAGDPHVLR